MTRGAKTIGVSVAVLLVVLSVRTLLGSAGDRPTSGARGVVLRDGREIRVGDAFDVVEGEFSPRSTLFEAKANTSLLVAVTDGVVAAVASTGSGQVKVPGFRFGVRLETLRNSKPGVVATEFVGRPAMMVEAEGVRMFAISLPDDQTCRFRGIANQVIIASEVGERLVREFLAAEPPCVPGGERRILV